MNPLVYVLAFVGVLAVVMLLLAIFAGRDRESEVAERLDRYTGEAEGKAEEADLDEEAKRLARMTDGLNKAIEKRTFATRIARRLSQASVKLTVVEYIILTMVSMLLGGALFWLIFRNLLFVAGFVVGFFVPRTILSILKGQRLKKFNDQLGDTINLLVNGLRSGYSMPQAMEAVASDMPPPVSEEFHRITLEIGLGVPLEQALDHIVQRVGSADLDLMITAINVQHEVGGNLAQILEIISHTIRERVRIQGEIKTLVAQGELTGYVLSFLPFFIGAVLFLLNRDYMGLMFVTPCGWIMSAAVVILVAVGFTLMKKITKIEV